MDLWPILTLIFTYPGVDCGSSEVQEEQRQGEIQMESEPFLKP